MVKLDYGYFLQAFKKFCEYIDQNKEYLTELDSAIGDGDHGINMERGCQTALKKIDGLNSEFPSDLFKNISMAMLSSVGGASGPLYGTIFMKLSAALSGKKEVSLKDLEGSLESALNGIKAIGKAQVGDKTMVDVWEPVVMELKKKLDTDDIKNLPESIIALAEDSMKKTIPLVARKGRASYLGERSANHQDPGATSSYLFFKALFEAMPTEK
jgi:dihydroxyacetone kinase-like protein